SQMTEKSKITIGPLDSQFRGFHADRIAAFEQSQQQQRHAGHQQVQAGHGEVVGERPAGRIGRLLGLEHHVLQADHGNQRGGLDQHQPVVGEAGDRQADHLRHLDAEEHLAVAHAVGVAGLALPLGNRHEGAAEG
ncbi:hypothetical protein UF34_22610, partial [Vibrio parahaemolyticus]